MNKKIIVAILALFLLQAPQAQAGFFDFFKTKIAAIGLALANIFRSNSPPRVVSDDTTGNTTTGDKISQSNSFLGEDPNNYKTSTELVEQPSTADCTPINLGHRCSYAENDQAKSSSCLNPVAVKTGSKTSGTGRTGN
ncbi:hypothetical protein [Pseudobdellovibrio sp. HCB154]|uniref:hypothetical protein n=1 Tax=Pseudobdellovibrio sp. HCB154 TaxID=3386277 RepID=UPI003916EC52